MEKKSGITVTREGLFIPTQYFKAMSDQLEIVLAAKEIRIRSAAKKVPAIRKRVIKRAPVNAE